MEFDKLRFKPFSCIDGVKATTFFDNGYGASVIIGKYTIGGTKGLYELAILDKYDIDPFNPIIKEIEENEDLFPEIDYSGGVIYSLTKEKVEYYLNRIKKLPKK